MNFTKFLRATFLQNTSGRLILRITYSVLSGKLAISFSTFQSSFFQVKLANHYEFRVIFQDIEHVIKSSLN